MALIVTGCNSGGGSTDPDKPADLEQVNNQGAANPAATENEGN